MAIPPQTLGDLIIDSPCSVPLDEMQSNRFGRFCDHCDRQVFDMVGLTTAEADRLFADPADSPCVLLCHRADGQVITADSPIGVRGRIWRGLRRRSAWAASLFAVLFFQGCQTAYGSPARPIKSPPSVQDKPGDHVIPTNDRTRQ